MRLASVHDSSAQFLPVDSVRLRAPDDPIAPRLDVDALRREARALGRFILRREVEPAFVERYVEAHQHLPLATADAGERATVAFAVAHPRLLPPMDAASALVRPHGLLHRKAILMLAILEAAPAHADDFLPRRVGWIELALVVVGAGIGSAARVALGVPLLVATRGRR